MVPILVLPLTFALYSVYLLISESDSSLVARLGIGIDADQWLSYQFKTEAVRPFKYLLFDLLHVTAEKNSAIDPQPIPFDHRNSVFTIKGMMKWGFSETRFSDRYLTNLPGSISVFRVFSLS